MKLDIKARLRNKYFWVSMLSLVVLLLDQLGIKLPVDINGIKLWAPNGESGYGGTIGVIKYCFAITKIYITINNTLMRLKNT